MDRDIIQATWLGGGGGGEQWRYRMGDEFFEDSQPFLASLWVALKIPHCTASAIKSVKKRKSLWMLSETERCLFCYLKNRNVLK